MFMLSLGMLCLLSTDMQIRQPMKQHVDHDHTVLVHMNTNSQINVKTSICKIEVENIRDSDILKNSAVQWLSLTN